MDIAQDWERTQLGGTVVERTSLIGRESLRATRSREQLSQESSHIRNLGSRALSLQHKQSEIKQSDDNSQDEEEDDDDSVEHEIDFEGSMMDKEWNTFNWSSEKIAIAISTLYSQFNNNTNDNAHQKIALKMFKRLMTHHVVARDIISSDCDFLVRKYMSRISSWHVGTTSDHFKYATFFATLSSPYLLPALRRERVVERVTRILLSLIDIRVRIVQHLYRCCRHYSSKNNAVMFRMKKLELVSQARHIRKVVLRDYDGNFPHSVIASYLSLIQILTSDNRIERMRFVSNGIFMLRHYLSSHTQLVLLILNQVALDVVHTEAILSSGITSHLSPLILSSSIDSEKVIDVLLALSHSCISTMTTEDKLLRKNLPYCIKTYFITPSLIKNLLQSENYIGLIVLQQLACSCDDAFDAILFVLVSLGGKFFRDLLLTSSTNHHHRCLATLSLIQQMTSKKRGRESFEMIDFLSVIKTYFNTDRYLTLLAIIYYSRSTREESDSSNDDDTDPTLSGALDYSRVTERIFVALYNIAVSRENDDNLYHSARVLYNAGTFPMIIDLLLKHNSNTTTEWYASTIIANVIVLPSPPSEEENNDDIITSYVVRNHQQLYKFLLQTIQNNDSNSSNTRDALIGFSRLARACPSSARYSVKRLHVLQDLVNCISSSSSSYEATNVVESEIASYAIRSIGYLVRGGSDNTSDKTVRKVLRDALPVILSTLHRVSLVSNVGRACCAALVDIYLVNDDTDSNSTNSFVKRVIVILSDVLKSNGNGRIEEEFYALVSVLARDNEGKKLIVTYNLVTYMLRGLNTTTARCNIIQNHVAEFIYKMANVNLPLVGNLNQVILSSNNKSPSVAAFLVKMIKHRSSVSALRATSELCRDIMYSVPIFMSEGLLKVLCETLVLHATDGFIHDKDYKSNDDTTTSAIVHYVLSCVLSIVSYPTKKNTSVLSSSIQGLVSRIGASYTLAIRDKSLRKKDDYGTVRIDVLAREILEKVSTKRTSTISSTTSTDDSDDDNSIRVIPWEDVECRVIKGSRKKKTTMTAGQKPKQRGRKSNKSSIKQDRVLRIESVTNDPRLLSTRPPSLLRRQGHDTNSVEEEQPSMTYKFSRPTGGKPHREKKVPSNLMLDPLFQSTSKSDTTCDDDDNAISCCIAVDKTTRVNMLGHYIIVRKA